MSVGTAEGTSVVLSSLMARKCSWKDIKDVQGFCQYWGRWALWTERCHRKPRALSWRNPQLAKRKSLLFMEDGFYSQLLH